jgi:hypothetical protein
LDDPRAVHGVVFNSGATASPLSPLDWSRRSRRTSRHPTSTVQVKVNPTLCTKDPSRGGLRPRLFPVMRCGRGVLRLHSASGKRQRPSSRPIRNSLVPNRSPCLRLYRRGSPERTLTTQWGHGPLSGSAVLRGARRDWQSKVPVALLENGLPVDIVRSGIFV